jgi:hypothetical protein
MKCFNCGKAEKILRIGKELVSDIHRIETDLKDFYDEEEKFMPLCGACLKRWQQGNLNEIEQKWINEKNKSRYLKL